ncbi:MAG TPA: DNA polymerase III subunit gamma/tau [Bacteroidetes bacterium]|nr:DNA polymerase III subunit gamma/tau [Bacteroidota bacterium]
MENFIVSARKYRPVLFREVIGQETTTQTLKNAIISQHLAQSYLFCGPRGIGKTTVARILAKTINCEHPTPEGEPCNECESCKAFMENRSFNIHELDAASNNTVDDIRNLIDQIRIPPQVGKYSVYIIDEVHMLSQQAFNAFLKTLEEPPPYAIFIMATTEKQKILPTILSRCQVFDFNRIGVEDIVQHLQYVSEQEKIQAEPEALNVIAQKADGALRDALSIFDQLVSFSGRNLTYQMVIKSLNVLDYDYYFKITGNLLEGNATESLLIFNEILSKGFDAQHFLSGLSSHFRDLLVAHDKVTLPLLEVGAVVREQYLKQARKCPVDFLYKALDICYQADITYRSSKNQRLHVELALLKISALKKKPEQPNEIEQPPKDAKKQTSSLVDTKVRNNTPVPKEEKSVPPAGNEVTGQYNVNHKDTETVDDAGITQPATGQVHAKKSSEMPSTISIKDALNGDIIKQSRCDEVGEEKVAVREPMPEKPFTLEKLTRKWMEYAERMSRKKPRFAAALRIHMPEMIDEKNIRIILENKNLKEDFEQNLKPDLMDYLKKELDNYGIRLHIEVEKNTGGTSSRKPYTPEERFVYLAKKNPELQNLKRQFDLDFE